MIRSAHRTRAFRTPEIVFGILSSCTVPYSWRAERGSPRVFGGSPRPPRRLHLLGIRWRLVWALIVARGVAPLGTRRRLSAGIHVRVSSWWDFARLSRRRFRRRRRSSPCGSRGSRGHPAWGRPVLLMKLWERIRGDVCTILCLAGLAGMPGTSSRIRVILVGSQLRYVSSAALSLGSLRWVSVRAVHRRECRSPRWMLEVRIAVLSWRRGRCWQRVSTLLRWLLLTRPLVDAEWLDAGGVGG